MKNKLTMVILTILTITGLVLIIPSAIQWQALLIQAGLGNSAPLASGVLQMAGGMICLAIVWGIVRPTQNNV